MNTLIHLWLEPIIANNRRCSKKMYFNCVVEGDYSVLDMKDMDDLVGDILIKPIMEFADISHNWNYGFISAIRTNKKVSIEYAVSTEEIAKRKEVEKDKKRISKILNSNKSLSIEKSNIKILDNGKLKITLPTINMSQEIDFPEIWKSLEDSIVGKIKDGDSVVLTDDNGNVLFELQGGSFLNVGLADLSVYDKNKAPKNIGLMNYGEGLKGGLFVRDDGSLDIGDFERTFYLKIHTGNFLKSSLKLKKSSIELFLEKVKFLNK